MSANVDHFSQAYHSRGITVTVVGLSLANSSRPATLRILPPPWPIVPQATSAERRALVYAVAAFERAEFSEKYCTWGVGLVLPGSAGGDGFVAVHTAAASHVYQVTPREPVDEAGFFEMACRLVSELIVSEPSADRCDWLPWTTSTQSARPHELLARVWHRRHPYVWSLPGGEMLSEHAAPPFGLLSGSFDPLHQGHEAMRAAAERTMGRPVFFELSMVNADKPALDFITLETRSQQFAGVPAVLTAAATFVDKSQLFPETTFVIGIDTAVRLFEKRFYGDSESTMMEALRQIGENGCRFMVAGRNVEGTFRGLEAITIPAEFAELFVPLPESRFRCDISSTELRRSNFNS